MAESFQGLLLRHRGRTRLTQRQLAARVGVSRGSVQDWEAGLNCPDAQHLQALIVAFLDAGGLTVGGETTEAEALWAVAVRQAPRMQTPFDAVWWAGLLARRAGSAQPEGPTGPEVVVVEASASRTSERRQDWNEAPDVLGFVGRAEELATLRTWVLAEHCRLVAVLGMGGIGKTMLTAKLAQDVAPAFQRVYWRGLRDALPISEWLAGAIGFLSDQQLVPPEGEAARLNVLLQLLRERPCLLVLDNFDTLLEPGQHEGGYRNRFGGYGAVLKAVGETRHEGCLMVTSRESPPELAVLSGSVVRTLQLGGRGVPEGKVLLANKQLAGNPEDWADLVSRFGGNGLALKVVGESIHEVFGGDIRVFLEEAGSGTVIGGIRRLLTEQTERSSALEQNVLRVLAVEREPVKIAEIIPELGPRVSRGAVLEALEALRRRSLVERAETDGSAGFTLQSVVLEYVTDRLVEDVRDEIAHGRPVQLVDQPLIKAQAKDYVRQTQERLIGEPILRQLQAEDGYGGAEQKLLTLLDAWRDSWKANQGYGPGSLVNLLRLLRGSLNGLDLSRLLLRQVYLAEVDAHDASLAGAHLSEAVLAEAFNYPISVALSGDGASLLAGTSAGEVWLWRVADRRPLLAVRAHAGPVYGVALSADGRLLASASQDGTVRLWEAPIGKLLATLQGHTSGVWGVTLSADGRLVATGSFDGTIRLWEAPGGQSVAALQGHTGPIYGVALSANGRLLASGGEDGTVRLWDTPAGSLLSTLEGHTGGVRGVALSADGRLLASGSRDATIRLWEAAGGRLLATLHGHTGLIYGVALSADGRLVASGSLDATIRLWEAPFASREGGEQFAGRTADSGHSPAAPPSGGQPLAILQGHTGGVRGVALSADGRSLASGGLDGTVRVWEAPSGRLLAILQGQTGLVYGVALTEDGRLLAAGSLDGYIRLWDTRSGQLQATLQGRPGLIHDVTLSADGRLLASGSWDGTIQLWDAPSGQLLATLQGHTGGVRCVALSADGRLLASGGLDGMIRLWETPAGRLRATLSGHTAGVRSVALSADGLLLASCSWDGTIRLWETEGWRPLHTLQGHTGPVYVIAISAGGRLLASGGEDGTVRLWNATNGQLLTTLEGHTDGVRGVALSADGRLVASGSWDGTIRLWEPPLAAIQRRADSGDSGGRLLSTLHGHTSGVWGVALSADGGLLASGSFDGTIRLWQTSSGTCQRTLRNNRRYERMNITGLTGVTEAHRAALLALGAVEQRPYGEAPVEVTSESAL